MHFPYIYRIIEAQRGILLLPVFKHLKFIKTLVGTFISFHLAIYSQLIGYWLPSKGKRNV